MIITILLILSILLNIGLYICLNKALNKIDIANLWIYEFKAQVDTLYNELKKLDRMQMFEKDDDVGVLFRQIADIIKNVNDIVNKE